MLKSRGFLFSLLFGRSENSFYIYFTNLIFERLIRKQELTKARALRNAGNKKASEFGLEIDTEVLRSRKIGFRNWGFFRGSEVLIPQRDMRGCLLATVGKRRNGKRTSGDWHSLLVFFCLFYLKGCPSNTQEAKTKCMVSLFLFYIKPTNYH